MYINNTLPPLKWRPFNRAGMGGLHEDMPVIDTQCAAAIYEQCPWDTNHVEAIYLPLSGATIADGQWHDYPPLPDEIGRYRVFDNRYFQVVFANAPNSVYNALTAMDPVDSQDDTEWLVWELEEGDGYALTSSFAYTPGPFEHQEMINDWLDRHGLWLGLDIFHSQGVAYFAEIEPGCLRDAMDRLAWLENALADLNQKIERVAEQFWQSVKEESDAILNQPEAAFDPDEIIPLPSRYKPMGWKRREPIALDPAEADAAIPGE